MKCFVLCYFSVIMLQLSQQNKEDVRALNCSDKGVYIDSLRDCSCIPGYDTYPKDSEVRCNYELKTRQTAMFSSLIGGMIGADMIYLGYTIKGIFKSFFPICVALFVLRLQNYTALQSWKYSYYISFFPVIISLLLWIVDVIQIINGNIKDSNGFSLYNN